MLLASILLSISIPERSFSFNTAASFFVDIPDLPCFKFVNWVWLIPLTLLASPAL